MPKNASVSGLRVLYIDYGVGFGGATKSAALMLTSIKGVRFRVFTSQDPEIIDTWYSNVPTHRFRRLISYHMKGRLERWMSKNFTSSVARAAALKAFSLADAAATVWNTLRISVAVIVHRINVIHLVNGYVPTEGVWVSRLTGVPCVANMRGFWLGPDPLLPAHVRRNCHLVGDSQAVTASVPISWCPEERRRTIYETVDVSAIEEAGEERVAMRNRYGIADSAIVFSIMGRILPWKGQLQFVQAMSLAMKDDPRILAMIVGDGPHSYMTEVKEAVKASGFEDRFIFTGYSARVEPYYAAADVIVHASIEPEPCGMVVMEGMAAGRPVIAAAAGGPLELVRHGVDGLLVAPGDIEGIREAVARLACDAALCDAMSRSGHHRARQLFDLPIIANEYRRLYSDLRAGGEGRVA